MVRSIVIWNCTRWHTCFLVLVSKLLIGKPHKARRYDHKYPPGVNHFVCSAAPTNKALNCPQKSIIQHQSANVTSELLLRQKSECN